MLCLWAHQFIFFSSRTKKLFTNFKELILTKNAYYLDFKYVIFKPKKSENVSCFILREKYYCKKYFCPYV